MPIGNLDLAILVVYMAGTIALGLWLGRGRTAVDYLLGGRDLPWWALLLSIVATETSTATFLSVPGIAFGNGLPGTTGDLRYLQLPIGFCIGRAIAAFVLLPLYFRGELFTAYDVLRSRSGPAVRTVASGLFLVARTVADGLRLYLAAVVLQIMLGWSLPVCVAVTGATTLVYTVVGGIRAVVWTDVIQFFVYVLGALAALIVLCERVDGGLGGILDAARAHDGLRMFDLSFDLSSPYTLAAGVVGGAVLSIGSHGVDQIIVQRYLAARSLADARRALLWSGPIVLAQFALFLLIGLGLHAFHAAHPTAAPTFTKGDQVFADFIVRELPRGLVGIVLGAVFAAAMSTLSSSLSASASALVNDFLLPLTGRTTDDRYTLRAARGATMLFAGLQIAVGTSRLGGSDAIVNQVLTVANVTTGVILGLFLLALPARRSARASMVGLLTGLAATITAVFALSGQLAWPWFGVVTCGATLLGGCVAHLVTPVGTAPPEAA